MIYNIFFNKLDSIWFFFNFIWINFFLNSEMIYKFILINLILFDFFPILFELNFLNSEMIYNICRCPAVGFYQFISF